MTALQEALKRNKPAEIMEPSTKLQLADAVAKGQRRVAEFWGIEQEARAIAKKELDKLEMRYRSAKYIEHAGNAAFVFDMNTLKWRDSRGFPRLVLFRMDDPLFSIMADRRSWEIEPKLPARLAELYEDVGRLLERKAQRAGRGRVVSLSAKFTGFIPHDARQKIRDAQKFFERLFLVAEPVNMGLSVTARLPEDPVVAGWDGMRLWYICDFDITPVEEAALLEGPARRAR